MRNVYETRVANPVNAYSWLTNRGLPKEAKFQVRVRNRSCVFDCMERINLRPPFSTLLAIGNVVTNRHCRPYNNWTPVLETATISAVLFFGETHVVLTEPAFLPCRL